MARTRDWRRAQFKRYVQRVIDQEKYHDSWNVPNPTNEFHCWSDSKGNRRYFKTWQDVFEYRQVCGVVRANTRTLCSCYMCGNPRKHFGDKTLQEQRFEQSCNTVD